MDTVNDFSRSVDNFLKNVYSNKTANAVIGLFLVLYAGLAAPKLPRSVAKIFGNPVFKFVFLFLIAYMSSRNISVAIIASVALAISMQTFSYHQATKKVQDVVEEEINRIQENSDIEVTDTDVEPVEEVNDETLDLEPINDNLVKSQPQVQVEESNNTLIGQEADDEVAYVNQGDDYAKYETNLEEDELVGEYKPEGEYKSQSKLEEESLLRPEISIEADDNDVLYEEIKQEVPEPVAMEAEFNEELINYQNSGMLNSQVKDERNLLISEEVMPMQMDMAEDQVMPIEMDMAEEQIMTPMVKEEQVREEPVREEPVREESVREEPVREEPVEKDEPTPVVSGTCNVTGYSGDLSGYSGYEFANY